VFINKARGDSLKPLLSNTRLSIVHLTTSRLLLQGKMVSFSVGSYSSSEHSGSSSGSERPLRQGVDEGGAETTSRSSGAVSSQASGFVSVGMDGVERGVSAPSHDGLSTGSASREESERGSELSPFEVNWLDSEVVKAASLYTTPSSIESFVDRVDILGASLPDNAFSARKCHHSDREFFGRGSSPVDFFFLYAKVIKDSRLRLPLDEFSTGVLRALNVAPTQLHPNSWAYIRGFQMLCLGLGLTATPALFLHHYCTRPGKKVGWLSLVS